ncbi:MULTISPECIES: 50S ribosomal protein L5 [Thermaerobacter]|uniref:Large ribosomal subunit protein uL5 n=1 Tax=Thermaerobacter composti TaxID=554949 RepID=A0ABZ0QNG6_9FIRM|nr:MULTISPECIES: 50S ribosomal protein L5 [Thermaerobacter]PZN09409.1 MAG: 50S ribosomal protein L5 [Bacillota bacterium]QBS37020.1 50S ribosomal protein L5 [Thermaerobacter sp. FW80]WPD19031.1 50S ribosomal protein L5 [Thermaerobacter composti]
MATVVTNLKEKYEKEVVPALMERFGYTSIMQVPRIEKIVINMGVGDAIQNPKLLDSAVKELALITGQRPMVTRAKKSISAFKVRKGMAIGCKVTLRKQRMWDFLTKLIFLALPRVRDFRGLDPDSFDGRGNYTLGLREQLIFPEIDYDDIEKVRGMDVTIVTTAETDEEARELLRLLGMPFRQ